jgi:RHS repeat-associated protein
VLQSTQDWDTRGRLLQVRDGSNAVISSYRYGPDGIRSAVTQGANTLLYAVDAMGPSGYAQVIEERTAGGVFVASYVYGAGLDPLSVTKDLDGVAGLETGYYLADGHSGVRQIISALGAVMAALRYDAFGVAAVPASGPWAGGNVIGYRGERLDGALGQYYLRARMYDPRQGRFTAVDPFAGTYSDPLQSMRYGYAGNNPVGNADPSGMFAIFSASILGSLNFRTSYELRTIQRGINIGAAALTLGAFAGFVTRLGLDAVDGKGPLAGKAPTATVFAFNASALVSLLPNGNNIIGNAGIGASFSVEFLYINNDPANLHVYIAPGVSIGSAGGNFSAQAGFVWGVEKPGDYEGHFLTASASIASRVPSWLAGLWRNPGFGPAGGASISAFYDPTNFDSGSYGVTWGGSISANSFNYSPGNLVGGIGYATTYSYYLYKGAIPIPPANRGAVANAAAAGIQALENGAAFVANAILGALRGNG